MSDNRHCWHGNHAETNVFAVFRPGSWLNIVCCRCGKRTEIMGDEIIKPGHGPHCPEKTINYVYPTDECPETKEPTNEP